MLANDRVIFHIILLSLFVLLSNEIQFEKIQISKEEVMHSVSAMSAYSNQNNCIKNAVENLYGNCASLDEDYQARFALTLTNCLLEKSGKITFNCSLEIPFKECSKHLQGDAWSTYNMFFGHTTSLCHYYTAIKWHENSSKLINDLQISASNIQEFILQNYEKTLKILDMQDQVEEKLEKTLENLDETHKNFRDGLEEMTNKQGKLNGEINDLIQSVANQEESLHDFSAVFQKNVDSISNIGSLIGTGVSATKNLAFFISVLILIMYLTSFKCTYQDKLPLMLLVLIYYSVELIIIELAIINAQQIWLLRIGMLVLCFSKLVYSQMTTKDLEVLTYQEIKEIKDKMNRYNTPRLKLALKESCESILKNLVNNKKTISILKIKEEGIKTHMIEPSDLTSKFEAEHNQMARIGFKRSYQNKIISTE